MNSTLFVLIVPVAVMSCLVEGAAHCRPPRVHTGSFPIQQHVCLANSGQYLAVECILESVRGTKNCLCFGVLAG